MASGRSTPDLFCYEGCESPAEQLPPLVPPGPIQWDTLLQELLTPARMRKEPRKEKAVKVDAAPCAQVSFVRGVLGEEMESGETSQANEPEEQLSTIDLGDFYNGSVRVHDEKATEGDNSSEDEDGSTGYPYNLPETSVGVPPVSDGGEQENGREGAEEEEDGENLSSTIVEAFLGRYLDAFVDADPEAQAENMREAALEKAARKAKEDPQGVEEGAGEDSSPGEGSSESELSVEDERVSGEPPLVDDTKSCPGTCAAVEEAAVVEESSASQEKEQVSVPESSCAPKPCGSVKHVNLATSKFMKESAQKQAEDIALACKKAKRKRDEEDDDEDDEDEEPEMKRSRIEETEEGVDESEVVKVIKLLKGTSVCDYKKMVKHMSDSHKQIIKHVARSSADWKPITLKAVKELIAEGKLRAEGPKNKFRWEMLVPLYVDCNGYVLGYQKYTGPVVLKPIESPEVELLEEKIRSKCGLAMVPVNVLCTPDVTFDKVMASGSSTYRKKRRLEATLRHLAKLIDSGHFPKDLTLSNFREGLYDDEAVQVKLDLYRFNPENVEQRNTVFEKVANFLLNTGVYFEDDFDLPGAVEEMYYGPFQYYGAFSSYMKTFFSA